MIGQLQALRLTLDEGQPLDTAGTSSVASFEWISSTEPESAAEPLPETPSLPAGRPVPWSPAWDLSLQVALTPSDFLAVDLAPLRALADSSLHACWLQESGLLWLGWHELWLLGAVLGGDCWRGITHRIVLLLYLRVCGALSTCACTAHHILKVSGLVVQRCTLPTSRDLRVNVFTLKV